MTNNFDISHVIRLSDLILIASDKQKLKKAVYSKPVNKSVLKSSLTLKQSNGKPFLQLETLYKDNKAKHRNFYFDDNISEQLTEIAAEYGQINLITSDGECEYKCSSSGKNVLLGADKLLRRLNYSASSTEPLSTNNREKKYILDGSENFLKLLDVSDNQGRVYDKKQAKFRQINRFLEILRDVEDKLPTDEITICDLCCGKSYLSFAVYYYFSVIKKYQVSMIGVDLKPDVVQRCNETAQKLGFSGLEFVCEDVNVYSPPAHPSLIISLHACDIATDFVINKAIEWNVDVLLSTPCCHHELNHNIKSKELSFITDYSMLRQKLCDAATDALRLCRLEANGFTTAAIELIDPDETPKNIMLRAIRKKHFDVNSESARAAKKRYEDAKRFLCGDETQNLHF